MKRLLFVVPRYGRDIGGGAETLVKALATKLAQRGDRVEVFTTCARDNRTWENSFPEGEERIDEVMVRRFPVDPRDLEKWIPLQIRISQGMMLSLDEQFEWLKEGVNSTPLYAEILARQDEFDLMIFAPYLFSLTFFGSLLVPQKSALISCLHDESYAYVEAIGSMFRQVKGVFFNARAEGELAERIYGSLTGGEVGMGFEPIAEEARSSITPFFKDEFPYLLYLGRKETGKNVQLAIDYFIDGKERGAIPRELKLVILGGGSFGDLLRPEAEGRADIVDLPHVSERDKQRIIKNSLCLIQPSVNESFSIVLMEAWLLGVPVLVHAHCPVTREHVLESGGGLYFSDGEEFINVVKHLAENPQLRSMLGECGNRYVESRYSWEEVLKRFDLTYTEILERENLEKRE